MRKQLEASASADTRVSSTHLGPSAKKRTTQSTYTAAISSDCPTNTTEQAAVSSPNDDLGTEPSSGQGDQGSVGGPQFETFTP